MSRRNNAFLILVFPVAVLVWSIGWFFYWIGSRKKLGKLEKLSTSSDLEVFVLPPEKKQVAKDTYYETPEAWQKMSAAIIPYEQNLLVSTEKTQLLRRRNKYDILAVILTACRNRPRTQSWLIRHLGLSTSSAKFFLSFLVASKLVEVKKSQVQKTYTTTANGKKALRHYVVLTTQYFSL